MLDGTYFFECRCGSSEHTLRFVLDKDKTDPCIHTEVYLNLWERWYKRVWVALKYVFGYRCAYGHWDCWMLDGEDAGKLRDMVDDFAKYVKDNNLGTTSCRSKKDENEAKTEER